MKKKLNINLHLWVLHYICYIWYLKKKLYNAIKDVFAIYLVGFFVFLPRHKWAKSK